MVNPIDPLARAFGEKEVKQLDPELQKTVSRSLETLMSGKKIFPSSLCSLSGGLLGMIDQGEGPMLFGICDPVKIAPAFQKFSGEFSELQRLQLLMAPLSSENATALRELVPYTSPQTLGLAASFGFGDRIGLATSGHAMAAADVAGKVAPIFAQQSIREMYRTARTPSEVMDDATWGIFRTGWMLPFGADADHLKTKSDVDVTAQAGFVLFTIDPSEYVDQETDDYDRRQAEERFQELVDHRIEGATDFVKLYGGKTYEIEGRDQRFRVTFDELLLKRAAVKYGRALAHTYELANHVAKRMGPRPFELEISVDETPQPTSALEHLFIALELKRHGISIVSLAPRFVGDFEKALDYKGDLKRFEESLKQHVAIAEQYGPYKISVHSGSDKFSIYPSVGRICEGRFHVKTAGTSYLEALRVVCRVNTELFRAIIKFARGRFEVDRASYHFSARPDLVPEAHDLENGQLEKTYLDQDHGRQILHLTFGSVLTEKTDSGYLFRERIRTILRENQELYEELLTRHLGRHLQLLLRD